MKTNFFQKKVKIKDLENIVNWDFSQIYEQVKKDNQLNSIEEAKRLMHHYYDVIVSVNFKGNEINAFFWFQDSQSERTSDKFLLEDKDQVINDMYRLMNQNKLENYHEV